MSEEFFQKVESLYEDKSISQKWLKKCDQFFSNFSYLNTELLIEDQIQKLTHIGVNSMRESNALIQKMTSENLKIMEEKLSVVIKDINFLNTQFEQLEKGIKQKAGIFSSKTDSQVFFENFKKYEGNLRNQINELKIKNNSLGEIKNTLTGHLEQLIDCYVLLERDIKLLNQSQELEKSDKSLVRQIYQKTSFELTTIKTDLLTQQQIIYQKYAGVKILLQNILNCHKNINFIASVTFSAIMNVVELQQIIQMGQSKLNEKQTQSLQKAKESLILATTELRLITATPFALHKN